MKDQIALILFLLICLLTLVFYLSVKSIRKDFENPLMQSVIPYFSELLNEVDLIGVQERLEYLECQEAVRLGKAEGKC